MEILPCIVQPRMSFPTLISVLVQYYN